MTGRRNFFRTLAGAGAAIAALWSAPKVKSIITYDIAAANLEKSSGAYLLQMSEPGRLLVCQSLLWFGDDSRKYESGFVYLPTPGKWFVYADDPNYRGGKVKYEATMNPCEVHSKNGRIFFGSFHRTV